MQETSVDMRYSLYEDGVLYSVQTYTSVFYSTDMNSRCNLDY